MNYDTGLPPEAFVVRIHLANLPRSFSSTEVVRSSPATGRRTAKGPMAAGHDRKDWCRSERKTWGISWSSDDQGAPSRPEL